MKPEVVKQHNECPMVIRWKYFKNNNPTAGLFCSCHDAFIDWLPKDIAFDLIDNEKVPVELWKPRIKKKKSK